MTDLPESMIAARLHRLGPPDVLEIATVPVPRPAPGQVLVRVRAAGINPVDAAARAVQLPFMPPYRFPVIPGWDVAGEVVAVGDGVTRFDVGDEVFGLAGFPGPAGTHAQYAAVAESELANRPAELTWAEAAALPLAGLTVLQVFAAAGGVRPGQRVLVEAAAGGVGHLAAQIAKHAGATVLGTATVRNHPFLRSLGVDEPIDHTAGDTYASRADLDLVVDSIGPEVAARAVRSVAPGGALVSIRAGVDAEVAAEADARGVRHANVLVRPDGGGVAELVALVRKCALRVELDAVFGLRDIAEAHRRIETRKTVGKIAIIVDH